MPAHRTVAPIDEGGESTPYGGITRMTGEGGLNEIPTQGDPQQALANATSEIRKAEETIVGLSQSYPQASNEIRRAREAIRSVLKKIVSEPGGAERPAPRTEL